MSYLKYILTFYTAACDTEKFSNLFILKDLPCNHEIILNVKLINWASYLLNTKLIIKDRKYKVGLSIPYPSTFVYNSLLSPITK